MEAAHEFDGIMRSKLAEATGAGRVKRRTSGAVPRRSPVKRHDSVTGATRCKRCGAACAGGTTVTVKETGAVFHAACFLCDTCGGDLRPSVGRDDGKSAVSFFPAPAGSRGPCFALCRACYAANVAPKCAGCREPVMDGPSLRAGPNNDIYHLRCFACSSCRTALGGGDGKKAPKHGGGRRGSEIKTEPFAFHKGQLLCSRCYAEECAPRCASPRCGKPIVGAYTEWEGKPYHKACFSCGHCGATVAAQVWRHKQTGAPLCTGCHDGLYNPRCGGCGRAVASADLAAGAGKARALEALGATWHAACFRCAACGTRLTGRFVDGPPVGPTGGGRGGGGGGAPPLGLEAAQSLPSIKAMKAALAAAGVSIPRVLEKAELVQLYAQHCGADAVCRAVPAGRAARFWAAFGVWHAVRRGLPRGAFKVAALPAALAARVVGARPSGG